MQPFSVYCETCGAKLKVRDPAAVGQIHACPRCESMVLIAAPVAAVTLDQTVAAPTPPTTSAGDDTLAPTDFAAEVDHLLAASPEPQASETVESVHTAESLEQTGGTAPPDTAEIAATPAASKTTLWITIGAGSLALVGLGLLAGMWLLRGDTDTSATPQVASSVDPAATSPTVDEPTKPAAAEEPPGDAVAVNKPVVEAKPDAEPAPANHPAPVESEPPPTRVATLPDLPPASNVTPPPVEQPKAATVDTLPPIDPLGIDSANLDLLLIPDADLNADPDPEPQMQPEPDGGEEALVVASASPIRFEPGSAKRGPTFAEGFADGELDSRLAMNLPAVAWRGTPLDVAVDELTRLSGVPITLTPQALARAAVPADYAVKLASENATVRELAGTLAAAVRLEAQQTPFGLTLAKEGMEVRRTHKYDLTGLAETEEQAAALAELTQKCVAPETWAGDDTSIKVDGASVVVEQPTTVHYSTLLFYERLRLARGVPNLSKYPRELLSIEPRLRSLAEPLATPTTFAFVDWTPLADVFSYWRQAAGVAVLVDWERLGDIDLRPMATMAASANNAPWGEALDACLEPLELAWVPVDGSSIFITTADYADQYAWVEFYPGTTAAELREKVEAAASPDHLSTMVMVDDLSGKFVIVRGNRDVHQAVSR